MAELARHLALPRRWTVDDLTAALERECGRAVVWLPVPQDFPHQLCGVHLSGPRAMVLCYRQSANAATGRRQYAHAAAHLLLDNGRPVHGVPQVAAALVSGDQADGEETDDLLAEREADYLATIILRSPMRRATPGASQCPGRQSGHTAG
jgi:hypothetical protein